MIKSNPCYINKELYGNIQFVMAKKDKKNPLVSWLMEALAPIIMSPVMKMFPVPEKPKPPKPADNDKKK